MERELFEIKAMLSLILLIVFIRVTAEHTATLAAEASSAANAEVHEVCARCGQPKIYFKTARLVPKADDPKQKK